MQKNFLFFSLSFLFFFSIKSLATENHTLKLADSLFVIGQFQQAKEIYQVHAEKEKFVNPNILLKLAYIYEKEGDYTQCLYNLSRVSKYEPTIALFEKMSTMGEVHQLSGYDFNDFSYFVIYFKRYGFVVYFVLILFGFYILRIMFLKSKLKERIRPVHRWFMTVYLIALLVVFNWTEFFHYGIIKDDPSFLRAYPSSASPAIKEFNKGHKVPVLMNIDQWRLIWWNNKFVFVREDALLLL